MSLSNNKLTTLPLDLSNLKFLKAISLKNNPFANLQDIVNSLKTIPLLINLEINLGTNEEAQLVLNTLNSLKLLNGETIESDSETSDHNIEESTKEQPKIEPQTSNPPALEELKIPQKPEEKIPMGRGIKPPSLEDLTDAAKIFDTIRAIRRSEKPDEDKELGKLFENQMTKVVFELKEHLKGDKPNYMKSAMICKVKYQLLNMAFEQLIKMYGTKKNSDIWMKINIMYGDLFDSFIGILNIVDAENKLRPQISQELLNSELAKIKSEAEIQINDFKEKLKKNDDELEKVKNDFKKEKEDLQNQVKSLEEENKKYLQTLIKHSKESANINSPNAPIVYNSTKSLKNDNNNLSPVQPPENTQNTVSENQPKNAVSKNSGKKPRFSTEEVRPLSLNLLKETINDIYAQKIKFDEVCNNSRLPKETMEQYMYTYFKRRYGLKPLIIEWVTAIVNGIKRFSKEDSDIALFGKILQNECDEEYRMVHNEVKNAIFTILKSKLRKRFPLKTDSNIQVLLNEIQNSIIEEWAYESILKKMYNEEDSNILLEQIKEKIISQDTKKQNTKIISFNDFQRIVLNYQLTKHEKYLKKFTILFKKINEDTNGILNEYEFRLLMKEMGIIKEESEVEQLLKRVDPYENSQITYSECISLLTTETVTNTSQEIEESQRKPESILDIFNEINGESSESNILPKIDSKGSIEN